MNGTDRYAYASRLRRVDPIPKLCVAGVVSAVCLCCPGIAVGLSTLAVMSALTLGLGGLRPKVLLHFFTVPLAFLLLGCVTIVVESRPLGSEMLLAIRVGERLWGLSPTAPAVAGGIFCKAMGVISATYFLALNTPITDLCLALERLRVPRLFVELMELIYRFVFVLGDAAGRIRVAQESRLGYTGLRRGLHSAGVLASMVFLRAWRQGDRVYAALESRGYTGALATLPNHYQGGRTLYLWGLGVVGVQLLSLCLERGIVPW